MYIQTGLRVCAHFLAWKDSSLTNKIKQGFHSSMAYCQCEQWDCAHVVLQCFRLTR